MILLLDVGNTHTHLGLANSKRVVRHHDIKTSNWASGLAQQQTAAFKGSHPITGVAWCSVVPEATRLISIWSARSLGIQGVELTFRNLVGVGVRYRRPETIGPDRLANAVAVKCRFGAPALVVDFGTAVTFDVVDPAGDYVGGIIAPGLSCMTDYLHEKTALLPRIKIREPKGTIGRSTRQAMLAGAVHGYRGLIKELIYQIRKELDVEYLPVVATGGYARLIAANLPEITLVDPLLTLEGLRIVAQAQLGPPKIKKPSFDTPSTV